jgi:Zn-dependent alcohol dehydrogenase
LYYCHIGVRFAGDTEGSIVAVEARVVVATGQPGPLQIEEVELPEPGPHQVVVRILCTGICHSQLHDIHGATASGRPTALGHEATGEIVEAGAEVRAVAAGQRVYVTWLPRDGGPLDRPLEAPVVEDRSGRKLSFFNVFTWADVVVCDELFVVPMPDDLATDVTAIIGCAVMTGSGAILNTAGVRSGQSVAIFGVGGVGTCALVAAKMVGASPIIAVDVDDAKLEWARSQGATHTVNAAVVDPVAAIHDLTLDVTRHSLAGSPVSGVDFALDCIGGDKVAPLLLPSVRSQPMATTERGTAVLVGIVTVPTLAVNVGDLLGNEKRLIGSVGGSCVPSRDFPIFTDWYRRGDLDLAAIVTRRFALEEINEAVDALSAGRIIGRSIVDLRAG